MRNLKLEIEYDGTNYRGWQIQNNRRHLASGGQTKTIQETIEKVLRKVLQEKVKLIGSGRTDSGVHALSQAANFKTNSTLSLEEIQKALNSLLPADISVRKITRVASSFHARYSARSKAYRYFILNSNLPAVFLDKFSWRIPYKLDIGKMRQAARVLLGRHDFQSFCASGSSAKNTERTVKRISLKAISCKLHPVKGALISIDIEADGFLYNMVRNIVGTLVEIGRGKLKEDGLKKILLGQDRRLAGPTAPSKGLFLVGVKY